MQTGPRGQIVFRRRVEAQQQARIGSAMARGDQFDPRPQPRAQISLDAGQSGSIDQIGFVEQDEIGAGQLIDESFLDRIVVIGRGHLLGRRSEGAGGESRAVHHHHNAIDRDARRIVGQSKALTRGLGSASPEVSIRM